MVIKENGDEGEARKHEDDKDIRSLLDWPDEL